MGKGGFDYQPRSAEDYEERANQSGYAQKKSFVDTKIKMFKPKVGENCIRILPPTWKNAKHYGFDIWLHYGIGADENTYLCLQMMKGEPCPICEEHRRALKSEADENYVKSLEPKKSVLVYLIDRDDKKQIDPYLYRMPWGIDKDIAKRSVNKRSGKVMNVDDPEDGYDIFFEREGTTKTNTKYLAVGLDPDGSSGLGKYKEDWLDFITDNPIPDVLIYEDYEVIKKDFEGGDKKSDKKGGGKEEDRDSRRSRRSERGTDDDDRDTRRRGRDDDDRDTKRGKKDDDDDRDSRRRGRDDDDRDSRRTKDDEDARGNRKKDDDDDRRGSRKRDDDEKVGDNNKRERRDRDDDSDKKKSEPKDEGVNDDLVSQYKIGDLDDMDRSDLTKIAKAFGLKQVDIDDLSNKQLRQECRDLITKYNGSKKDDKKKDDDDDRGGRGNRKAEIDDKMRKMREDE